MAETFTSARDSYDLVEQIGEGGFGVTWLARRESDGGEIALKQLKLARAREWKAVELFQREARVLSELEHPNIPDYVDYFTLEGSEGPEGFVLVQEFVRGRSLRQIWRDEESLTDREMLRWFFQILEVLEYLHDRSPPVIHRDISPKNIMLRDDGEAFLIDFGTVQAKLASASTVSSTSAGTFGYAAMEQFVGRAVPASDLYGLAMTFLAGNESSPTRFSTVAARSVRTVAT